MVFLAFGERADLYLQIYFSILSIYRHHGTEITYLVITDNPDRFTFAKNIAVTYRISTEDIKKWKGKHQFFWRVKMKSIEKAIELYPDNHTIYLDSDTVAYYPMTKLLENLDKGLRVMHKAEKVLSKMRDSASLNIHKNLQGFSYNNIRFTNDTEMCNAGVVGLPVSQGKSIIKKSIDLCDEMCNTEVDKVYLEQLSFSMTLAQDNKLRFANSEIIHYWGNKSKWNETISNFINEVFLRQLDFEQQVNLFNQIDLSKIAISSRPQNGNIKIKQLADKLFPKTRATFFKI